jgi:hypothetical protein
MISFKCFLYADQRQGLKSFVVYKYLFLPRGQMKRFRFNAISGWHKPEN